VIQRLLIYIRDKHALWYKSLLVVFCWVFITWTLPSDQLMEFDLGNAKGKPWTDENLIAPYDFPIQKSAEEYIAERKKILSSNSIYFKRNNANFQRKIETLKENLNRYNKKLYTVIVPEFDSILKKGLIENADSLAIKGDRAEIILVEDKTEKEFSKTDFYTLRSADEKIAKALAKYKLQNDTLHDYLVQHLAFTILYDASLNEKILQQSLNNVSPTKNKIVKGQIVISRGEIIDNEKYAVLSSLESEEKNRNRETIDYFFLITGRGIAIGLCLAMVFLFLFIFRKTIFSQNAHVTFIFLTISIFVFITSEVHHYGKFSVYSIPFVIAPIMIRAFFDTRTALFSYLNIVLICSFFVDTRFDFLFIQLFAGVAAIFSIANMTTRLQLVITTIVVFVIYALAFIAITLSWNPHTDALHSNDFIVFAVSSLLVLISYPLIFLFEKGFGFVSDFSLIELSDSNNPILRELATRAPGTFQHTLQVASIAEEATRAVGGNVLLVRAGAMYHDIGKLENPRYFTENQIAGVNPHEDFTYEESAAIIIKHVIKGIEMARENKLPEQIIDFIRTHHGTSLTRYFYKKNVNEAGVENVDEKKFRYPGPIPFSKETAVLMMSDSVEAASRSLKVYDAVSIDDLVERIINTQIEEQQFINSDITFRDITTIKKIFKKRLMNVYHVRIEYPR
jgi:hypothetical protein